MSFSTEENKGHMHIQHLNSCVYELTVDKEGNTKHLFKQHNNAIPVIGVVIERRHDTTFNELRAEILEKFQNHARESVKVMPAYPLNETNLDSKGDFTLIYGWLVEYRKNDPNQPIAVPVDDQEGYDAAMRAALMPYLVSVPFMLAFVETENFMFDVSLSHIPSGAITEVEDVEQVADETGDAFPVGLDPSHPFLSPEDTKYLRDIGHRINKFVFENPKVSEEEFSMTLHTIVGEVTGYTGAALTDFIGRMNTLQAMFDKQNHQHGDSCDCHKQA